MDLLEQRSMTHVELPEAAAEARSVGAARGCGGFRKVLSRLPCYHPYETSQRASHKYSLTKETSEQEQAEPARTQTPTLQWERWGNAGAFKFGKAPKTEGMRVRRGRARG